MTETQKNPKKKIRAKPLFLLGILALCTIGAAYFLSKPLSVFVFRAAPSNVIQTVVATGRISPPATIEIAPRHFGVVTHVAIAEGATVEAGTLLVQLDDRELLSQKISAEQAVAQAKLQLDNLRRVLSPKAAQDLKQAELSVSQAEDDFRRTEVLLSAGATNDRDLERVRLSLEQARSRRESVALQAGSLKAGGVEFRLALSALSSAEASLQQVETRIAETHLTAKIPGTVLSLRTDTGDTVQPGQVLVVLAATGELEVRVPIDEKNIAGVEPGRDALVSAEAYPDRHFTAVVDRLSPSVDAMRGTVEVALRLPNPPSYLRPEMTVSVEIEVARKQSVLAVPREALMNDAQGDAVLVAENGVIRRRPVKLGIRGFDFVEVESGISDGDLVLVDGFAKVAEGDRVKMEIATRVSSGEPR
jgi:HlyD family secretion protein